MVEALAVERALDEVRPHLAPDGGNIELVGIDGGVVTVRLLGPCATCDLQHVTLTTGVERVLKARVPGISAVRAG